MGQIRMLIVDDHPVAREGFRAMLSTDPDVEVVGEACDGLEAVATVSEKRPDMVLMDIRMPNLDGIEATRRIKEQFPGTAVVVLTMYDNDAYVVNAVRAGASGYLLKDASRELLAHTIRAVSSGATLVKTNLLYEAVSGLARPYDRVTDTRTPVNITVDALTARQQEVLQLMAEGSTNKQIAKELGIAEDTVKKHVQSIVAKLDASGRTQATMKAARAGLVR